MDHNTNPVIKTLATIASGKRKNLGMPISARREPRKDEEPARPAKNTNNVEAMASIPIGNFKNGPGAAIVPEISAAVSPSHPTQANHA